MPRVLALGVYNNATAILDTATGELHDWSKLATLVVRGDGGYLAGTNLYRYVGALNQIFEGHPGWRVQIRAKQRTLLRGDKRHVIGTFMPVQFGLVGDQKRSRDRSTRRIFHCMDLEEIADVRSVTIEDCVRYATSILELCEARGVKFTASRGGLASRLLKASPRWEPGRRAAPEFVNDLAREHLPGNYYGLGASTGRSYKRALYVDQVSAHHAVAATAKMPHPAGIRARGNHRQLETGTIASWLTDPGQVPGVGLLACRVSVGNIPDARKHLFPPFMHEPGRHLRYIYTNETEYFDGVHGAIEYVCAAWTGTAIDRAIPEYAEWAIEHRNRAIGRKPLLLAAYGALAFRSDRPTVAYYDVHRKGKNTYLPGAGQMKERTRTRKPGQPQPTIVNVLARGMIEAETRKRSLMLARNMDAMGIPVLSVYVDGLILETDSLPLLPPGWDVEATLTNVHFQHAAGFTSDQLTKLPGVPRGGSAASMMRAARVTAADPKSWKRGTWRRGEKESLAAAKRIVSANIRRAREEASATRRPTPITTLKGE